MKFRLNILKINLNRFISTFAILKLTKYNLGLKREKNK